MNTLTNPHRILVIDALRGFAILSIMLLHNIEHFDFYYFPEDLPAGIKQLDSIIWGTLFFLFAGKSYAMFALLFGFTYHIQSTNQLKKGKSFDLRFVWRLLLLFGFGMINSAFFEGDILTLYAAVGLLIIPIAKLPEKFIWVIIGVMFLMPIEWFRMWQAIQQPQDQLADPASWALFAKLPEYLSEGSFWQAAYGNLTNGKWAVILWNWENGRFFHMLALFLTGMLAGRRQLFVWNPNTQKWWKRALVYSLILFAILFAIQLQLKNWISNAALLRPLETVETAWSNISFMVFLIASFMLLFHQTKARMLLDVFTPIGKMSLSNYILQSMLGAFIYYGFGLGLYRYTGATYGFLIGLLLAVLTGVFCHYWMSRHRHGPLEGIWHQLTWWWK